MSAALGGPSGGNNIVVIDNGTGVRADRVATMVWAIHWVAPVAAGRSVGGAAGGVDPAGRTAARRHSRPRAWAADRRLPPPTPDFCSS